MVEEGSLDIAPNQTLYIHNLNDKLNKLEMRRLLYQLFSQFGCVFDIVSTKSARMKGQAFLVFDSTTTSTVALRSMQGFPLMGKPMQIQYAKSKSDFVARLDGTFQAREKEQREERRRLEKELTLLAYKKTKMFSNEELKD